MNVLRSLIGVALLLLLASATWAADLYVPSGYSTIQAAITAATPGDVIHVAAGVYHERLTVTKSLTLIGPQDGVDPAPSGARTNPAAEAVVDLVGVPLANPNVLVDIPSGVTDVRISGFSLLGSMTFHYADEAAVRCSDDRITLEYNIIEGYAAVLYKGNDDFVVNSSRITSPKQCVVVQPNPATLVSIRDNLLLLGPSPAADAQAIYLTGTTDSEVLGNVATGFIGSNGVGGSHHTRLLIAGNEFTGNKKNVNLWGTTTFVTISDNDLSGAVQMGINVKGQDITITGNKVTGGAGDGIVVDYNVIPTLRVTIADNDLSGNSGDALEVTPAVAETVDASGNWWGTNSAVAGEILGDADYSPWLDTGANSSPGPGFLGDFSTLWVDDDSPQTGSAGRVQEGCDLATGSTVNLLPGTYEEQVVVTTDDLTLDGAGAGSTIIKSPTAMTNYFISSGTTQNYPIVFVNGATGVTISDMTVDGFGRGNGNVRFEGIGFWNGDGSVSHVAVQNIQDTPFSGAQHGVGVYAYNNTGGPYAIELDHVDVTDFQKNGMALLGTGLTANVHDCTATGEGATAVTAQNGIQIGVGAGGTVADCAVSGVHYTGVSWTATGLLIQDGATVSVSGAVPITGCQTGSYWINTNGSFAGADVSGDTDYGVIIGNFNATKSAQGERERPAPSPFDEGASLGAKPPQTTSSSVVVSMSDGCLIGSDAPGSAALYVYSAGGPVSVTASGLEIRDWDTACFTDGAAATLVATGNSIVSNFYAGYDNTYGGALQNAESNWWGDASGPGGVGGGTGDAVLGLNVDFTPWLVSGADLDPDCGFTATSGTIGPVPPAGCISTGAPCMTVPMDIARSDGGANARGYRVKFTLSPELQLCSGVASITEDVYLSSAGATNFQVLDNGGGTYTVDCAILGLPCGQAAATGTLFNVAVKKGSVEGTGTITVDEVRLRDCDNVPLQASPGAPGSITVDMTPPVAVANLVATQVKTGNDGDGTTKVTLAFTAPVDAAVTEVYRAGFGGYPEYDDAGGAVPATPAIYPPPAPWTLTGVTATGQADEVDWPNRDFWYYVVYTKDACGNVSTVSNKTGGTLNYHLGDVHNGTADCTGNNVVNGSDISFLGFNYGISLVPSDPLACLDVGPTTNFSVNARPMTDNLVDFEDLMMFAINFFPVVSKSPVKPVAEPLDALSVDMQPGAPGEVIARLILQGSGRIQGLSVKLAWEGATPIGMSPGDLIASNGAVAYSPEPGVVDAAVLGVSGAGFTGRGVLATVTFRLAGEPRITLATTKARDAENAPVELAAVDVTPKPAGMPSVTELLPAMPNPFNPLTTLSYRLSKAGEMELCIFAVDGRRVKVLESGVVAAGNYRAAWDGTDDSGRRVSSGQYYARLRTSEVVHTRALMLLK